MRRDGDPNGRPAIPRAGLLLLAVAALVAVALPLYAWRLPGLVTLERSAYDARLALAAPRVAQDPRIVLVTIDEATVAATRRRSPIDRAMLARAIAAIDAAGPKAIAIDILFDQQTDPVEDRMLIAALRNARTPIRVADARGEGGGLMTGWQADALAAFLRAVGGDTVRPASAALFADADEVVRRMPPDRRRTLASEVARLGGGGRPDPDQPIDYRRARAADTPVFAHLPILGFSGATPGLGALLAPMLHDRIVLIGGDMPGTDRHRIPLAIDGSTSVAGIEVHGQIVASLLDRLHSRRVSGAGLWLWALLPAIFGLLTGWLPLRPGLRIALSIGNVAALVAIAVLLERPPGIQTYGLPLVGAISGALLMALVSGAVSRGMTVDERRIAREIARRYLPPAVAAEIERRPALLGVHGRRAEIAILFTDLAGFTELSERLPVETLSAVLNGYLEGMTDIILRHGGTLDKFIGDAIVAFWGAPLADREGAEKALRAALALQRFSRDYAARMQADGVALGHTRIGIHWGEASVGNFGGRRRVQYTAIGDAMNLAARLESANKSMGTEILASGAVIALAPAVPARDMGHIIVKGRAAAIPVFQLDDAIDGDIAAGHAALIARLRAGDADAQDDLARRMAAAPEDRALAFLADRAHSSGWTGVHRLETK